MQYVADNIYKCPEIRIVDKGDLCVMHIINQKLVFPLPPNVEGPLDWDKERKVFCLLLSSAYSMSAAANDS
jgi:hypothetical protein